MSNNIETENRFAELVAFIRNKSGEHEMPITRETLIEDDLGVTGNDAAELLIELSKKYNFDIANFKFSRYFNDEPSMFDTSRAVKPFAVGHLEKGIIAGRLDEEIINN
jgi:acyl carrier protein